MLDLAFFQSKLFQLMVVFARISAFIAFAPVLGSRAIPARVKALMAFVLSMAFLGLLSPYLPQAVESVWDTLWLLFVEASVGALLAFVALFFFEMVTFAGHLIDYEIGFGFANIVDPISGANVTIISYFLGFFTIVLFMSVGGHHVLMEAMLRSYDLIPVMGANLTELANQRVLAWSADIFSLGFRIASPMVVLMFVVNFSIGLIGKTVPQLQILVIGFPIKIAVGLVALGLVLPPLAGFIGDHVPLFREQWLFIMEALGGR